MAQQGFRGVAVLSHARLCTITFLRVHLQICSVHTCTDVPFSGAEVFDFCSLVLFQRKQTNLQSCQDGHHLFIWLSKSWETVERAVMKGRWGLNVQRAIVGKKWGVQDEKNLRRRRQESGWMTLGRPDKQTYCIYNDLYDFVHYWQGNF